eukprot:15351859-Ditylum_brightwellii.AAC.1
MRKWDMVSLLEDRTVLMKEMVMLLLLFDISVNDIDVGECDKTSGESASSASVMRCVRDDVEEGDGEAVS